MASEVLTNVLSGIMIYLSPIIFVVGAFTVANKLIDVIKNSFGSRVRVKHDW